MGLPFHGLECRQEIHLQRMRELGGRAEGNVDVALEDFRDVRAGDVHATRKLGLGKAERLHPPKDAAKKRRANMVNCFHRV